jgi:hypothetical protein
MDSSKKNTSDKEDLMKSDRDYYFENGLMVMTESYHINRGFCCGNKCRHCPYDYKNVTTEVK